MDSKKIIESLVKIAVKQQKIIHKLAQEAAPQDLTHNTIQHKDPTAVLTQALGAFYTKVLTGLSVDQNKHEVSVSFKPGAATQANYDHVLSTVQNLQNSNGIVGGPYKVRVA